MLSKTRRNSRSLHRVIAYAYLVSVISTLMFGVSHAVEVLVLFAGSGVRFHTAVVFLTQ